MGEETLISKSATCARFHEPTGTWMVLLTFARLALGTFTLQGVITYFGILYGTIVRATRSRLFAVVLWRWARHLG